MVMIGDMLTVILEKICLRPNLLVLTALFHFDPRIAIFRLSPFLSSNVVPNMGPKHGLKFNEGSRCKYVESERDQSNRWFFSRSGWRCCFTGDQHSGGHDREREFSQFPSGHGGAENGNRDILGAHRRGARWKQKSHRTEEQATGSRKLQKQLDALLAQALRNAPWLRSIDRIVGN